MNFIDKNKDGLGKHRYKHYMCMENININIKCVVCFEVLKLY